MGEQPGYLEPVFGNPLDSMAQLFHEPRPYPSVVPGVLPSHPRLQLGRFYRPGPSAIDYHDVLSLGGNRFAIVLANVTGAGAPAAAATLATVVRGHAGPQEDSGSLLHYMSEYFHYGCSDAVIATGICSVIDTRRRTIRVATAGHAAPLLARPGSVVAPMRLHNSSPLGKSGLILTTEHELRAADRLLFYSDGVISRRNGQHTRYDLERLTSMLQQTRDLPVTMAVETLAGDLDRFAGGIEAAADQTMMMVGIA